MIARITNFASKENQVKGWHVDLLRNHVDEIRPKDCYIRFGYLIEEMLNEFYLLLEKHPNALEDKIVFNKYKRLKKYADKYNLSINNCYSYLDRVKKNYDSFKYYGIRTVPDLGNVSISIVEYRTDGSLVLEKNNLNLKLIDSKLNFEGLFMGNSTWNHVLDSESLSYLEPKILTKHL